MTVDDLMEMFDVTTDGELGKLFFRTNKAVSKWRTNGEVPESIKKRALEIKKSAVEKVDIDRSGHCNISIYDISGSCGGGSLVDKESVIDKLEFREEWIRHVLRAKPENLVLIHATGDSMEPTLHSGDMVMVDRSINHIVDDSIYVIRVDGTVFIKRIRKKLDGTVVVISDNKDIYEPESYNGNGSNLLDIVGRVVWVGRVF